MRRWNQKPSGKSLTSTGVFATFFGLFFFKHKIQNWVLPCVALCPVRLQDILYQQAYLSWQKGQGSGAECCSLRECGSEFAGTLKEKFWCQNLVLLSLWEIGQTNEEKYWKIFHSLGSPRHPVFSISAYYSSFCVSCSSLCQHMNN